MNPFFNYKIYRYKEFRNWAVVKLGAPSIVLIFAILSLIALRHYSFIEYRGSVIFAICVIISYVCAHLYSYNYFDKVVNNFNEYIFRLGDHYRPHIVAHSLGTFLVGEALQKCAGLSFNTIILTGCVLKRRFSWTGLAKQYEYVSNEVAERDYVPYVASIASLNYFANDMGCSGALGFAEAAEEVHTTASNAANPGCGSQRCACVRHSMFPTCWARVHNVRHGRFRHGDYLEGVSHAQRFWLPTLLGYDPALYRQFLETCTRCDENGNLDELRSLCWGWTQGPLEDFIHKQISIECPAAPIDLLSAMTDVVIKIVCSSVFLAAEEAKKRQDRHEGRMKLLDLTRAVTNAIEAVLKKSGL